MGSKWRKAKLALGLNLCLYVPHAPEDPSSSINLPRGFSDASSSSAAVSPSTPSGCRTTTPTPSSSGLRVPKSPGTKSSKKTCAICLATMKSGQGYAIFTAECSHSFHFHCVTSNVKHGNQICPVCRAKWKEIPSQNPQIDPLPLARDDPRIPIAQRLPSPRLNPRRQTSSLFNPSEPCNFDDDEELDHQPELDKDRTSAEDVTNDNHCFGKLEVKIYPELSSVPKSASHNNFTILIHLKAPLTSSLQNIGETQNQLQNSRAPIDLVTVLDVSGSMAGTKLALLKRAMGFVTQNLGPSDRLSVIAFSSTARRIFPLRRMTDSGKHEALHAINSLISNGGTNIAEGLKKGAKVIMDRKWKNPVGSIVLLSDGQDTYTVKSPTGADYQSLVPESIQHNGDHDYKIPVHSFGFGIDHDAASMHSISEISGGTFSFIEAEGAIQDAFAQCIGGLLSVVGQGLRVEVNCVDQSLRLGSIKAGSYKTSFVDDARTGFIEVGDLYAEEERDFLVTIDIPVDRLKEEMTLLKVRCLYKDPITKELVTLEGRNEVKIMRPEVPGQPIVSIEVDRQRNRLHAAEAMGQARVAADKGDLSGAVSILESCRKVLSETVSARAGERLCVALGAELKEMQDRMASRRVYETSGRAYVLSGLSSHSWQRATARGDSTDSTSLVQAYQTQSMTDMVTRSQTMEFGNPVHPPQQRKLRQALSFPSRPHPR